MRRAILKFVGCDEWAGWMWTRRAATRNCRACHTMTVACVACEAATLAKRLRNGGASF